MGRSFTCWFRCLRDVNFPLWKMKGLECFQKTLAQFSDVLGLREGLAGRKYKYPISRCHSAAVLDQQNQILLAFLTWVYLFWGFSFEGHIRLVWQRCRKRMGAVLTDPCHGPVPTSPPFGQKQTAQVFKGSTWLFLSPNWRAKGIECRGGTAV